MLSTRAYQIKDINVILEQLLERDNELLVETVQEINGIKLGDHWA